MKNSAHKVSTKVVSDHCRWRGRYGSDGESSVLYGAIKHALVIATMLAVQNVYGSSNEGVSNVIGSPRIILEYPPEAKKKCIEGWVIVSFTVNPAGDVSKIKVIEEQPKDVFREAALKEVKKLKYPVREGGPVEGVRFKFSYNLTESELAACKP